MNPEARPGGPHATPVDFEDFRLTLSSLDAPRRLEDLKDRPGYLMISMKNRSFSNRLIEAFCRFTTQHLGLGIVIVVDAPYAANIEASEPEPAARERALAALARQGDENRRRVERILESHRPAPIVLQSWAETEAATPAWIVDEFQRAFRSAGRFRRDVLARTRSVLPASVPEHRLDGYARFLIRELPVLCDLYYRRHRGGIVDVYPGENPDLLWNLERGLYAADLPRASRLARSGPPLTYVDMRQGG